MDKSAKIKFEKTLHDLERIEGVEGTLVVDNQGEILYNSLLADDVSLFGSMANIISNSSENLLESSKQGMTERVLVESKHGNALFISLEKAHLVVMTAKSANLGMVMISSRTAAQTLKEMPEIKEIEIIEFVEEEIVVSPEIEETKLSVPESVPEKEVREKISATPVETETTETEGEKVPEVAAPLEAESAETPAPESISEPLAEEIIDITEKTTEEKAEESTEEPSAATSIEMEKATEEISEPSPSKIEPESVHTEEIGEKITAVPETSVAESKEEPVTIEETLETLKTIPEPEKEMVGEEKELKVEEEKVPVIPVIRPPLAFPPLPDNVEIPEGMEEKTALIISIYESVLLAMSIGASKIMGFAPARGMLIKSLPYDKCPETLHDVNVKSNSALEFDKIRANFKELPLENQVEKAIQDFTTIIAAITDNYGRVMGYDAFRGMIRPEFRKIYESYGSAMEELGIKEKIHPELRELLNN